MGYYTMFDCILYMFFCNDISFGIKIHDCRYIDFYLCRLHGLYNFVEKPKKETKTIEWPSLEDLKTVSNKRQGQKNTNMKGAPPRDGPL